MDFSEFRKRLEEDVGKIVSDSYSGASASQKEVEKLQGASYSALSINAEKSRIGMSLNMNALYEQMQNGETYDGILQETTKKALGFLANAPDYEIPNITDYEEVKPKLYVDVVGTQRNAAMLANVPHTEMADISMVCRIQVKGRDGEDGSILINNSLKEALGVDETQLLSDALGNAPNIRPSVVRGMGSVLGIPGGPDEATDGQLVVVTTEDMMKGASAIFYPGMMDSCSRMMKQDFFILPSSVHEVLLLADDGVTSARELQNMVRDINAMAVDPVDRLTDNVYHYDAAEKIFETGFQFEERRAAREAQKEKPASVLEELRGRQKENEMKPKTPHKAASHETAL